MRHSKQWQPLRDIVKFDGLRRYYWTYDPDFKEEPIRIAHVYESDAAELWDGQLEILAIEIFPPEEPNHDVV